MHRRVNDLVLKIPRPYLYFLPRLWNIKFSTDYACKHKPPPHLVLSLASTSPILPPLTKMVRDDASPAPTVSAPVINEINTSFLLFVIVPNRSTKLRMRHNWLNCVVQHTLPITHVLFSYCAFPLAACLSVSFSRFLSLSISLSIALFHGSAKDKQHNHTCEKWASNCYSDVDRHNERIVAPRSRQSCSTIYIDMSCIRSGNSVTIASDGLQGVQLCMRSVSR